MSIVSVHFNVFTSAVRLICLFCCLFVLFSILILVLSSCLHCTVYHVQNIRTLGGPQFPIVLLITYSTVA